MPIHSIKLQHLFFFVLLMFFSIRFTAQEKVKIAIDGNDKIEFKTNIIGDLLMNYLSSGSGSDNLFIGQNTGINTVHNSGLEGYYNTVIGNFAFTANQTGYFNTGLGRSALISNNTGNSNTALGAQTLFQNTTGSDNIAVGVNALKSNKQINKNIAIGNLAMENANDATSSSDGNNIAIGHAALQGSATPSSNTGTGNIAIGNSSLAPNTSGFYNTAVGTETMISNTTGERNVAIGTGTMGLNTVGSKNTAVGQGALLRNSGESNNTAIGFNALRNGNNSSTPAEGHNTAVGFEAMKGQSSSTPNNGKFNTGIGSSTLWSNTTGNSNTALGNYALYGNTEGTGNVGLGFQSGVSNTSGSQNIAIGSSSLYFNQTGNNNVAIGSNAGINAKGSGNVFIGYKAGELEIGTVSNKLYINNSGQTSDSALVYGEFDNHFLRFNAETKTYGFNPNVPAISGIKQYPGNTFSDEPGVYGVNTIDDFYGIGVLGEGNWYGVQGTSEQATGVYGIGFNVGVKGETTSSDEPAYAVSGFATQTNSYPNYGVYGSASDGSFNYSIYGANPGSGIDDWAGYFAGKVFAQGNIITNGEIEASSSGIKFNNGESLKKAIPLHYIICVSGTYPSSGSGPASDADLIGEVKLFAGNFAPTGWALCEGQILTIASNETLFTILGFTYGGDGSSTFALPDLREAVPVGKL